MMTDEKVVLSAGLRTVRPESIKRLEKLSAANDDYVRVEGPLCSVFTQGVDAVGSSVIQSGTQVMGLFSAGLETA